MGTLEKDINKWVKDGDFFYPPGVDVSNFGGKAERLIVAQEPAKKIGFKFPEAYCIPWQFLRSNGDFTEEQEELLRNIHRRNLRYFISSSAPGEDSLEARMPGIYTSCSPHHESFRNFLLYANSVLKSYDNKLAKALRKKHSIPDKGMGLLIRKIVIMPDSDPYEREEAVPDFAGVVNTSKRGFVEVAITSDNLGSVVVGRHPKYFATFEYDTKNKKLEKKSGKFEYSIDIVKDIVQKSLELEKFLGYPDDFGVDIEFASLYENGKLVHYLLQCPPVPRLEDVGPLPPENNIIIGVNGVIGSKKDVHAPRILITPQYGPYLREIAENLKKANEEFHDGYLLIMDEAYSCGTGIGQALRFEYYFNASAVVETKMDPMPFLHHEFGTPVDHASLLFRTERIPFISGNLDIQKITPNLKFDLEHFQLIERPVRVSVNEFKNQAGIYLV